MAKIPRCLAHHVWHAFCPACQEQHRAEQEAARERLEAAKR